jgi:hypothetical protein
MGCMFACMYAAWFDWFCYFETVVEKNVRPTIRSNTMCLLNE